MNIEGILNFMQTLSSVQEAEIERLREENETLRGERDEALSELRTVRVQVANPRTEEIILAIEAVIDDWPEDIVDSLLDEGYDPYTLLANAVEEA